MISVFFYFNKKLFPINSPTEVHPSMKWKEKSYSIYTVYEMNLVYEINLGYFHIWVESRFFHKAFLLIFTWNLVGIGLALDVLPNGH